MPENSFDPCPAASVWRFTTSAMLWFMSELEPTHSPPAQLLGDIRRLIAEARRQTAAAVNVGLTLLYWRVGKRIHLEVLGSERAAYGERIVVTLSRQLVAESTTMKENNHKDSRP